MKTAITTCAFGGVYQDIARVTYPTLRSYARRIGADFVPFETRRQPAERVVFEKLQIRDLLLGSYDRVLWLDSDIIVRSDAESLFDLVPQGTFGAWDEAPSSFLFDEISRRQHNDYAKILRDTCACLRLPETAWDGKWFCTGVFVVDRTHLQLLQEPSQYPPGWLGEQNYLNAMVQVLKLPVTVLESDYHLMFMSKKPRLEAYIVHYAGMTRGAGWTDWLGKGLGVADVIRRDLDTWRDQGLWIPDA